ncbi:MAG: hypothetical protein GTO45_17350 [Candidatus Aminicenantes bacterium]|nr:hypothetical protein [Candidatus Aminicenantes bacterium]NIN19898.1 hypothetical protein [Candidatus Aminicenantes bacterium]NIN41615.1 hypothetical protein [Candidatus Aminicenantes bacterium]NIN86524.1 hypothetical protein [Candidatus Aminicenantes bacterium]NIO80511.1 hypothetical protein [Candidatus Aminicenantes bacterium]
MPLKNQVGSWQLAVGSWQEEARKRRREEVGRIKIPEKKFFPGFFVVFSTVPFSFRQGIMEYWEVFANIEDNLFP